MIMRKKTSTIIGLAIATILTAYISALTMPNQAFAQGQGGAGGHGGWLYGHSGLLGGIGTGINAIIKFKQHKENPIMIGSGIGILHKFTP
jgi:hypothetical protein